MPKKAVGKVYKSVIMMRKVRNFERVAADNPEFLASRDPPHLQPPKPTSRHPLSTAYPTRPTFRSLYSQDPATFGQHPIPSPSTPATSSPPSSLLPNLAHSQTHAPLTYLQNLLGSATPSSTALNQELALQMITHVSHPPALRGTAPHNLKMAFLGRRVLEMHLQMFLMQAAQKRASEQEGSVLIDTQRATEEVRHAAPVVVGGEEDVKSSSSAAETLEEQEASENSVATNTNGNLPYTIIGDGGIELGDGTPGGLMDEVLSEYALGRFVGSKWKVNEVMLYDPGNAALSNRSTLSKLQGSVVQSIFGGLSHAYGAAFTSRFFYAHTLPLLESRMPEWTWHYIEEQRLKVVEEGGIWGGQQ